MTQQPLARDAWMREAQEASKIVEDIENRIKVKDLQQEHRLRVREVAKTKLLEVGIKLDRLESLLHNPPSKPILTEGDIEFRWKLLSDLRLRTRRLVSSLCTPPSSKREGGVSAVNTAGETNTTIGSYGQEQMNTLVSEDDPELLQPLVDKQSSSSNSMGFLRRVMWIICLILGAAAILFILVILCAII